MLADIRGHANKQEASRLTGRLVGSSVFCHWRGKTPGRSQRQDERSHVGGHGEIEWREGWGGGVRSPGKVAIKEKGSNCEENGIGYWRSWGWSP